MLFGASQVASYVGVFLGILRMTHDEVLMLIISATVIIEIAATFPYLRRVPYLFLLLSSFGALALCSFFTVAEGFFWASALNILEHLLAMIGAILLALWCALVFKSRRQEEA